MNADIAPQTMRFFIALDLLRCLPKRPLATDSRIQGLTRQDGTPKENGRRGAHQGVFSLPPTVFFSVTARGNSSRHGSRSVRSATALGGLAPGPGCVVRRH